MTEITKERLETVLTECRWNIKSAMPVLNRSYPAIYKWIKRYRLERPSHFRKDSAQTRKKFCPYGHEYSPTNTYVTMKGHRVCRTCAKLHKRKNAILQSAQKSTQEEK